MCQICDCPVNGVALCRRSESCPLPFHIKPVSKEDSQEQGNTNSKDESIMRKLHEGGAVVISGNKNSTSEDDSDDVKNKTISIDRSSDRDIGNRRKINSSRHGFGGNDTRPGHSTTVIVQDCKIGSRWLDGCKRCSCVNGKTVCNHDLCLKPRPFEEWVTQRPSRVCGRRGGNGRPCQRPPKIPFIRWKPVNLTHNDDAADSKQCGPKSGKFEVFWIKCNVCKCVHGHPMCTAKNCAMNRQ